MSAPAGAVPALVLQQLARRPMTTGELQEAARRNGVLLPALVAIALLELERDGAVVAVRIGRSSAGFAYPVLWAVRRR